MESALCTLLSALVVLLCSSPECKGEDTVTQPEGDASVFKGHTTINCTFETSDTTPYLYWYKQEEHGAPQYMMNKRRLSSGWTQTFKSSEFSESRFEIEKLPISCAVNRKQTWRRRV
uniref:Ig-like domain-containing protein n=1 Tax=Neogobius melanostomus TaxID=47308 RepID=A0A8C6TWC4_9GOBI